MIKTFFSDQDRFNEAIGHRVEEAQLNGLSLAQCQVQALAYEHL